jgi:hypothetical protein
MLAVVVVAGPGDDQWQAGWFGWGVAPRARRRPPKLVGEVLPTSPEGVTIQDEI